jgi:hypothetical protein
MQCPRGSEITTSEHQIKTLKNAQDWYEDVIEQDLPILIIKQKAANGRLRITIKDKNGKLIHQRG